jgi:hypothetical protein
MIVMGGSTNEKGVVIVLHHGCRVGRLSSVLVVNSTRMGVFSSEPSHCISLLGNSVDPSALGAPCEADVWFFFRPSSDLLLPAAEISRAHGEDG